MHSVEVMMCRTVVPAILFYQLFLIHTVHGLLQLLRTKHNLCGTRVIHPVCRFVVGGSESKLPMFLVVALVYVDSIAGNFCWVNFHVLAF